MKNIELIRFLDKNGNDKGGFEFNGFETFYNFLLNNSKIKIERGDMIKTGDDDIIFLNYKKHITKSEKKMILDDLSFNYLNLITLKTL